MGGVLARRRHHPPRNLGLGPRPDRARRLVGLPFGRRAPARSASSSPPSASRSRRQASAPTLSSSGKAQRRRSGPTAAISSFRRRRPQTTVSIIGCSRTAMTATRPPPHPARPPSAATASAASARSKARPLRLFAMRERSRKIAASPISSSLPSPRSEMPRRPGDRRSACAQG
jgi:hypothetical protein